VVPAKGTVAAVGSAVGLGAQKAEPQRTAPLAFVALALLAWSGYAYTVVRVNADILAEAIQVQQWLADPFWVVSYPGQVHGGIVEYPLIALAETLAPGNVYVLTLVRILYIPLVGVLLASCVSMARPQRSLWPFAIAAAVGPAVLHGFRMISDIYPSAWLLSALGLWLVFRWSSGRTQRIAWLVAGGVLIGLGIYQHASAAVLSIPLFVFACVQWRVRVRQGLWVVAGIVLGLIPMGLAMFAQPGKDVVYRPERSGLPDVLGALGLDRGELGWRDAMLPNGLGVAHADSTFLDLGWGVQWWINLIAVVFLLAVVVVGVLLRRSALGWMWLAALAVVVGLVVFVPPIWYYGTPIGFLLWFSVGFVPVLFPRSAEWVVIGVVMAISAGFSFAQVWNSHPRFVTGAQVKAEQVAEVGEVASAISKAGVEYVFGDYWEVLPIAYASSMSVHPISYNFNRFPLDPAEVGEEIVVAVTPGTIALPFGRDSWSLSADALALVDEVCTPVPDITLRLPEKVSAHLCPTAMLMERR
jgi:hypothetical protein